ncbi:MAG: hypothetical protein WCF90_05070 [Methanomicrobiales archaeon]
MGRWCTGTEILIGVIAVVVVVSLLTVLTLTIAVIDLQTGTSFPFGTSYRVSLPDGQLVTIGTTKIFAIIMPDGVGVSVDGAKEKLAIGQTRIIQPLYARFTALGVPLMDTNFQITLKYLGHSGSNALFDLMIKTSKQVPEQVISKLITPSMGAQPVSLFCRESPGVRVFFQK